MHHLSRHHADRAARAQWSCVSRAWCDTATAERALPRDAMRPEAPSASEGRGRSVLSALLAGLAVAAWIVA